MSIKSYANKAAYDAAVKSTIESQVSMIETSRDVVIDGVNVVTGDPVSGDVLFLDESNNKVFLKGGAALQKAIIPSAWTHVGYVVARFGRKALIIDKDAADLKYVDVVQFKVTVPAETGTLSLGAQFVTAGTTTTISVAYTAGMTLAAAANTYEENDDTLCGRINTALAALEGITGDWWAYMNDANEVIVQRDTWTDYRQYNCSGALTHITWGDMPASDVYFKNDGGYTNYWGVMNVTRTRAWATNSGRVPTTMEPVKVTGNPSPVKPACFEDPTNEAYPYTALIRAAYGTYDNYLRNGYGVMYPQKYGTFALPDAATLSATYALQSAPTKTGGEKYKFPALYRCYAVTYGVDGLDIGDWHLPGSLEGCYLMDDDNLAAIAASVTKMGTTSINNATSRWFAERGSVYTARYFYGTYGFLNIIGVNYSVRVQAVALLNLD